MFPAGSFMTNEINPDLFPGEFDPNESNPNENNPDKSNTLNDFGQLMLPKMATNIHVISIIGQVEGHLIMPPQNKATKYEHIIPQLVAVEQCDDIEGLIVILNTVGGDVEAGLAIAEMIASMTKPTVSLVLGGGHSIGVAIAVAAKASYIAPSASMTIHPIRLTGMVVGVQQSFDYLERMQERVTNFITAHSSISAEKFRELMLTTGELARDVGTLVVGQDAVEYGLLDHVGGLGESLACLRDMISENKKKEQKTKPPKDTGHKEKEHKDKEAKPVKAKKEKE